jgi:hypothetical protein
LFNQRTYSGLATERLVELLRAFRNISALPDDRAVKELDQLLTSLRRELTGDDIPEDLRWQHQRALQDIDRLREHIDRVKAGMVAAGPPQLWDFDSLRMTASNMDDYLDPRVKAMLLNQIQALQHEAAIVADKAEVAAHSRIITDAGSQVIHSASSVRSIIGTVDDSVNFLRSKNKLSPDNEDLARKAKERAARYRSQRKLDEADVAEAGGNAKKAEKLRKEAAVILTQDWAQAFPGQALPAP